MTLYRPIPVSEDNDPDGHVEDCVPCSGLMQANAYSGGTHPATLAEAEAIRAAGGAPPTGGVSSQQLVAGTQARYHWAATIEGTPAAIIASLKVGSNATVSGSLGNFPAGHHLRRFSPTFTGGHRVWVGVEAGPVYWWIDPLAPPNSGYKGEAVTLAEVTTFAQGHAGGTIAPTHVLPVATYHVRIAAGATVTSYVLSASGCLTGTQVRKWGTTASSAPCKAPVAKAGCISGSATVVYVTSGVFVGRWVRLGTGVTVVSG